MSCYGAICCIFAVVRPHINANVCEILRLVCIVTKEPADNDGLLIAKDVPKLVEIQLFVCFSFYIHIYLLYKLSSCSTIVSSSKMWIANMSTLSSMHIYKYL